MKKHLFAFKLAFFLAGVTFYIGEVSAGVSIAGTGGIGGLAVTDATSFRVNRGGGRGHIAIIPYYSTQSGNSTLINITNTDGNGKVVKVRFRSAVNADTVYDFTLLLGSGDVWSANISQDANGLSKLSTTDTSYTLPANINEAFKLNRLPASGLTAAKLAEMTREGYVEIITMADVPAGNDCAPSTSRPPNRLYNALLRPISTCLANSSNPSADDAAAISSLSNEPQNESAAINLGLDTPTSGLLVTSIIVNVFDASIAWTTPTTSITAVNSAGNPARGRLVFSPQINDSAPNVDFYTNDPLLRSVPGGGVGKIVAKQYDLPDLSTPYLGIFDNSVDYPSRHVETVSAIMAGKTLANEYLLEANIFARTDWSITLPTRRFSFGVDYSTSPASPVWNSGSAGISSYFISGNGLVSGFKGCIDVFADNTPVFLDRSMHGYVARPSFSDEVVRLRSLCGAAPVLVFEPEPVTRSVLRAVTTQASIFPPDSLVEALPLGVDAGWAWLAAPGTGFGMPLLGTAYIQAQGPLVSGKSTNFGILYIHDVR